MSPRPPKPPKTFAQHQAARRTTVIISHIWTVGLCVHLGWFWPLAVGAVVVAVVALVAIGRENEAEDRENSARANVDKQRAP